MNVLGIESTAHTFSISIAQKKNTKSQIEILATASDKYPSTSEGYIPYKLADHHAQVFQQLLEKALHDAHISLKEINAIAYSQGSGLGHCLHVGFVSAKTLSHLLKVPLVPVNHSVAHIEIGREFNCKTSNPLVVYVSGGNTQKMQLDSKKHVYHIYGETLDLGIGNFLDVLGRELKLNPPDAVGVVSSAKNGSNYIEMPYTVRGMNLSFSGLQTFISKKLIGKNNTNDICFSAQETAFAMLGETTERALCHTNAKELLLCGGNARNARLQEILASVAKEHGATFACTSFEYSGDQAAMIALTGLKMLQRKCISKELEPKQRYRTDAVHVCW